MIMQYLLTDEEEETVHEVFEERYYRINKKMMVRYIARVSTSQLLGTIV